HDSRNRVTEKSSLEFDTFEEIVFSIMKSLEEEISCCGCTTTENAASVADEIRSRDVGDEISCLLRGWEDEPCGHAFDSLCDGFASLLPFLFGDFG
ncbi:hypothetical protein KI387_014954, partial [Taxus chinensis]